MQIVIIFLIFGASNSEPLHAIFETIAQGIMGQKFSTVSSEKLSPSPDPVPVAESPSPQNKGLAQVIDKALQKEFKEEEENLDKDEGKEFNKTATEKDAQLETVVRVSHKPIVKPQNTTQNTNTSDATTNSSQSNTQKNESNNGEQQTNEQEEETDLENQQVDKIIDSQDNVFIMSSPHTWNALTLDPQLIQDLTVVFCASAIGGMIFELLKQPVISGYLVAGSLVGPGGLGLIQELVQIESLAQIGIQILLFTLGLEFSISKLWPVKYVAVIGGILQILTFIVIGGLGAFLAGAQYSEGVLIGAIISMSSTSILVKIFDSSQIMQQQPFNQIVVGTLILQDCMVGLLFALIPVLGHLATPEGGNRAARVISILMTKLLLGMVFVWLVGKYLFQQLVPFFQRVATKELFQISLFGWCMFGAWVGNKLGISAELGAFLAGTILVTGDQQDHVISESIDSTKTLFVGLFIASIGLIVSPLFLYRHILLLSTVTGMVIVIKSVLVTWVVIFFGYKIKIAFAVGTCLAQIGEFAFVLLGIGLQLKLISGSLYLMMLGVTALSILVTPLVLKFTERLLGQNQLYEQDQNYGNQLDLLPVSVVQQQQNIDQVIKKIGSYSEGTSNSWKTSINEARIRKGSTA